MLRQWLQRRAERRRAAQDAEQRRRHAPGERDPLHLLNPANPLAAVNLIAASEPAPVHHTRTEPPFGPHHDPAVSHSHAPVSHDTGIAHAVHHDGGYSGGFDSGSGGHSH